MTESTPRVPLDKNTDPSDDALPPPAPELPTAPEPPAPAPPATASPRKLTRSRDEKWLGGVCGGLAAYFGIDVTLVRAIFVVSVVLPGPQVLLYLLLWLIIPQA